MDWIRLLQMGAEYIQNNDDPSTTGLDVGAIASALGSILGSGDEGGIDLASMVRRAQESGLMDVVSSWIGSGENAPIDAEGIERLLGPEQIAAFAQQLGVSEESARNALAQVLPQIVDQATNEEPSLAQQLLEQVGGIEGAINLLRKFF